MAYFNLRKWQCDGCDMIADERPTNYDNLRLSMVVGRHPANGGETRMNEIKYEELCPGCSKELMALIGERFTAKRTATRARDGITSTHPPSKGV